ncbi:unnamed protein product [Mucor hiemalis]
MKPLMKEYQERIEENPDLWHRIEMQEVLETNLKHLGKLMNCDSEDLVFVMHASEGVNNVLRSFPFEEGDKILCFHTAYASIDKTLDFLRDHHKVELVRLQLDYPMEDDDIVRLAKEAIEREHAKTNEKRIRFALCDAISSSPGVRFPFEAVNKLAKDNGILSLIDGAHAVGHIDFDLGELDPDFFITNCYKWLYVPRGSAVLYVPKRNQGLIHPASINPFYKHHTDAGDYSSFKQEHIFSAIDPTPFLCVGAALQYRESIGGEAAIREYCHEIAVKGGQLVAEMFGTQILENSTGTLTANMVNVELPPFISSKSDGEIAAFYVRKSLYEYNTILHVYKTNKRWWVRLSGQVYLELDDFQKAGEAVLAITRELNKEA